MTHACPVFNPSIKLPICRANRTFVLDRPTKVGYNSPYQNKFSERVFEMGEIVTQGRITTLLGRRQMTTGERLSLRGLADLAQVPKDLIYRLDAGQARYVELDALARLCRALQCHLEDLLVWNHDQ